MKKTFFFKILIFASLAIFISSCSSINGDNENAARIGVIFAVMKIIDQDIEKAEKVCSIANDAQSFFDSNVLPVDEIEKLIRDKINFSKLDSAETVLVEALIIEIKIKIQDGEASGFIDPETKVTATKVLGWVKIASC